MFRFHLVAIVVFMGVAVAGMDRAVADNAGIERGNAVIEQWCRTCHQRVANPLNPDGAPTFETIAMRPGRTEAYLTRFMDKDHFPMTTFRLFDHEKRDVIAYIVALKNAK